MAGDLSGLKQASATSPLECFNGTIERTRTGPVYLAGLAIVALAMVLLPLIYLALIAFVAWAVVWHLRNDTWIFGGESGRGGFSQLLIYLGPAVVGGILIFFMIKPFFARRAKGAQPVTLDHAREPLLFGFVRKICDLVGAHPPCRIDVDCQVNASASLQRGLWSNDLVLTIGLPLAAGLDMRQFAGVLAHEFGHFSQGAGMRLTYVIRRINFWFARVVYERDDWDLNLEQAASGTDWRLRIVLHAARGCVWFTRRILQVLMQTGHAISCFMLRQMEYDADSYEAKVAGSEVFEATAARLRLLNVATRVAYEDVQQSWISKRLPENLPLLISHKAASLPAEAHQKLAGQAGAEKTRWFDTHPCDADRARAARRLALPGVFHLAAPATSLFSGFDELSKSVTRHRYKEELKLEFSEQNLMSAEDILRESAASVQADALTRKFFGGVNVNLKPLFGTGDLLPVTADENTLKEWHEAQALTEALRPEAEKMSAACLEQQTALVKFTTANILAVAGFKLKPEVFGLPPHLMSLTEIEVAALQARNRATADLEARLKQLDPFLSALGRRVILALRLGQAKDDPAQAKNTAYMAALLAAVGEQIPSAHEIGAQLNAFAVLAQNRQNHPRPVQVDEVLAELVQRFQSRVGLMQERLKAFPYPFAHARGQLTVAEYALFEKPADSEWIRAYQHANAHVERLFTLHYRLIGQILARADTVESDLANGMNAAPSTA